MDRLKLKWKIVTYLLAFCALLLVILWLFQTVFLNDVYKLIRKGEIIKAMAVVESNIDSDNLQSVLSTLAKDHDILVTLTDDFKLPQVLKPDRRERRLSTEAVTETKEFVTQNGSKVSLTFYAIITPVTATVTTIRYQLYIITGVMVILSVLIAIIIAKRISKPIEKINDSAKLLASGDYNTSFSGRGFLEIYELSQTLNTAATELSKVEGLRRELMANISHDLRTPLALIYSYAEMMHDFPTEITPDQTQLIIDETKRLTSLVNDIMDISKLENGRMTLTLKEYNITKNIDQTVNRVFNLVKNDGYTITFECHDEVMITADEVKITQTLYNLLINAINYCGDNKKVVVRQRVTDSVVTIEVIDYGEGISEENLPYIWDRYYKVDKAHKRAVTGTGIGLSIVKRIVTLHGGSCGVSSKLGEGSTFWFSLRL